MKERIIRGAKETVKGFKKQFQDMKTNHPFLMKNNLKEAITMENAQEQKVDSEGYMHLSDSQEPDRSFDTFGFLDFEDPFQNLDIGV